MARKKLKLEYITCNSKRRNIFRQRKSGIIKKVSEISTLCGIQACAIIYEENNPQAEVWPSDLGVRNVLSRFESLPELERSKKMVDQEAFLRQSIAKVYEELKKQRDETRKKEMTNIIDHYIYTGYFNGNLMGKYDINDFSSFIDESLKEISQKMNIMQIEAQEEVSNEGQVNGTHAQEHHSHDQGLVSGGDDQLANFEQFAQGLE